MVSAVPTFRVKRYIHRANLCENWQHENGVKMCSSVSRWWQSQIRKVVVM